MGIFIKTRRMAMHILPFNEAVRKRAIAALILLEPFLKYALGVHVKVYRYAPVTLESTPSGQVISLNLVFKPDMSKESRMKLLEYRLENLLKTAESAFKTLFETYVVVEVTYKPPILLDPIKIYLCISNGYMLPADIELEVYEWVRGEEVVVETLEETLELLEPADGVPRLEDLMLRVGVFNEKVKQCGFVVERAVAGRLPGALWDMTEAKMYWLPTENKIVSIAIDTIYHRRDIDAEAATLYDYYAPHRKDIIVTLLTNRPEYKAYVRSLSSRGIAEVIPATSVLVVAKDGTLAKLYRDLVDGILKPFAETVLVKKLSELKMKANETVPKFYTKLLKSR